MEPRAYLADVITRIVEGHPNRRLDDLLPWAYPPTAASASSIASYLRVMPCRAKKRHKLLVLVCRPRSAKASRNSCRKIAGPAS